jgi:hypothetical protein
VVAAVVEMPIIAHPEMVILVLLTLEAAAAAAVVSAHLREMVATAEVES